MSQTDTVPTGSARASLVTGLTAQTLYDKCMALARNLWWSWHPDVINLFRDLDPIRWRQWSRSNSKAVRMPLPEWIPVGWEAPLRNQGHNAQMEVIYE